jgi:hypothetical protein
MRNMWKWFCCFSAEAQALPKTLTTYDLYASYSEYYGAGLHFIDEADGSVVAGAQLNKTKPCISGFGGKAEPDDGSSVITAYRETIEELCGVSVGRDFIRGLINDLGLVPLAHENADGYVYYLLSQRDMINIIGYVWMRRRFAGHIRYYVGHYPPQSVEEVIRNRVSGAEDEVGRLYILHGDGGGSVDGLPLDPSFAKDLELIHLWHIAHINGAEKN